FRNRCRELALGDRQAEALLRELGANAGGGAGAEIGEDQRVLDFVQGRVVEAGGADRGGEILAETLGGLAKAAEQPFRAGEFAHCRRPARIAVAGRVTGGPGAVPPDRARRPKLRAGPVPSLSARTVSSAPRSPASQAPRTSRTSARSSAARAVITRLSSCGMRAAGVPGRGEYGNTWPWTMPSSRTIERLAACIASSSVGKPAIRSAPIAMSGRRARSCSTSRTASARKWRR